MTTYFKLGTDPDTNIWEKESTPAFVFQKFQLCFSNYSNQHKHKSKKTNQSYAYIANEGQVNVKRDGWITWHILNKRIRNTNIKNSKSEKRYKTLNKI